MKEKFQNIAFSPADILLPDKNRVDLKTWSVVACDQFSSQPEYWADAEKNVGGAPSALRLILPEAQLNSPDVDGHIAAINRAMEDYLARGLFTVLPEALVYVERTQSDGQVRRGLVGKIDLDCYDFTPGSGALIRATEGTVLSRIPPRVQVRRDAPLELPHVMLLIDDPANTVLGPLADDARNGGGMEKLYDFPLMLGGGSVAGWRLTAAQTDGAADALAALCAPEEQARKYGVPGAAPLLFAVGDGNHSLATAKQCWEDLKATLPTAEQADHPARYALVEVVNLHDDALQFEPIHRVLFGTDPEAVIQAFRETWPDAYENTADGTADGPSGGTAGVTSDGTSGAGHTIQFVWGSRELSLTVPRPRAQLAVGTLQAFLDDYVERHGGTVDYIHEEDTARELAAKPGNLGFLLPPMGKDQLFKTVIADGVLPRKTFSMGHAQDKRYYLEGRKIRERE